MAERKIKDGALEIEFSHDPYTPVMVYCITGESATFDCAIQEGDIEGYELSQAEVNWLAKHEDAANEHYNVYRDFEA